MPDWRPTYETQLHALRVAPLRARHHPALRRMVLQVSRSLAGASCAANACRFRALEPTYKAGREAREEAGIPAEARFMELRAVCSVPVYLFRDGAAWGDTLYVIPEYSFGVDCTGRQISLSREHSELRWLTFDEARERLTYDSNKTALWELHQKLRGLG